MTECSIGPRHTSGLSPGLRKPIDISLTPYCSSGCMRSPKAIGVSLIPIMSGTLGPYTSASIRPVLWPNAARPTARLTATVVLPTPPFPDPTAIRCLTPGIGSLGIWPGWLGDMCLYGNRLLREAAFLGVALPAHRVQPAQFLAQGFHALGVDHFVCLAEVIQLLEPPVRPMPQLGTSPVTDGLVLADLALGMGDGLLRREGVAPRAARDFAPRVHGHVAQFPAALHEKVAGVDVAVVLHHHVAIARLVHGAVARFLPRQRFGDVVEDADPHLAALRPPQLENLAEEPPVLPRRDGV